MKKIEMLLKKNGISLVILDLEDDGYFDPLLKIVFVNQNLSEENQKKVIYHEIGHGKLHIELAALYKLPVPHSKMENEADKFMISRLLEDYISVSGVEASQINYMKFIEDNELDSRYEDIVKALIVQRAFQWRFA